MWNVQLPAFEPSASNSCDNLFPKFSLCIVGVDIDVGVDVFFSSATAGELSSTTRTSPATETGEKDQILLVIMSIL